MKKHIEKQISCDRDAARCSAPYCRSTTDVTVSIAIGLEASSLNRWPERGDTVRESLPEVT